MRNSGPVLQAGLRTHLDPSSPLNPDCYTSETRLLLHTGPNEGQHICIPVEAPDVPYILDGSTDHAMI